MSVKIHSVKIHEEVCGLFTDPKQIKINFENLNVPFKKNDKWDHTVFREALKNEFKDEKIDCNLWGVYSIWFEKKCLYVGTGAPILERIVEHNREANAKKSGESKKYHDTFNKCLKNQVEIKMYECKVKEEPIPKTNSKETNSKHSNQSEDGQKKRLKLECLIKCQDNPDFWN
jgi:predicted GIY-YIG superfamily endonuclease